MNAAIDLRRLQHFIFLAEELNFTRAAHRAHLSQTAFSRSIQALESSFSVGLFDRDTRVVRLTTAGQQLVEKARHLLKQSRDLVRDIDDIANSDGGELKFGASLMAIDCVLKLAMPALMNKRPNLRVNVEAGHWRYLQTRLEQESIEFFVGYPGLLRHQSDFLVTPLPAIPSSVFCRPEHPLLTQARKPHPHDLGCFPWASVQLRDRANVDMRKLFGVPADSPLPLSLECNDLSLLRQSVLGTDMILFTWGSWLTADLQQRQIVDLGEMLSPSLQHRAWRIECAIVQMAGRTPSPIAQRLMDIIVNQ